MANFLWTMSMWPTWTPQTKEDWRNWLHWSLKTALLSCSVWRIVLIFIRRDCRIISAYLWTKIWPQCPSSETTILRPWLTTLWISKDVWILHLIQLSASLWTRLTPGWELISCQSLSKTTTLTSNNTEKRSKHLLMTLFFSNWTKAHERWSIFSSKEIRQSLRMT